MVKGTYGLCTVTVTVCSVESAAVSGPVAAVGGCAVMVTRPGFLAEANPGPG